MLTHLTGKKFGLLTILLAFKIGKRYRAACICECGQTTEKGLGDLQTGHTKSCGCLHGFGFPNKHGGTSGKMKPEYWVWKKMRQRCYYKKDSNYHWYGGRGIGVCERWRWDFGNFLADMGPRPHAKMTLERVNNDLDYSPTNCKWATWLEQARNKRPRPPWSRRKKHVA